MNGISTRVMASAAFGLGAIAMSAPAQAAVTVCTAAQLANAAGATSCYFVAGNANSNSAANRTDQQAAIGALGAATFVYNFGTNANNSFQDGTGHTSLGTSIGFGTDLFGETIVSMHFGNGENNPFGKRKGGGGVTAFYLFDFAAPTSSITLTNAASLSNAHLFVTNDVPAVPEPSTWALLILGFGGVGGMMRSARKRRTALAFG